MDEKIVRRGYVPADAQEFGPGAVPVLAKAAADVRLLLERDYPPEPVITFVGNHYQLSARQRMALTRGVCSADQVRQRQAKRCGHVAGTVYIDGFNTVITLEVALSGSLLIAADDGTIRDLAGLHGTFRIVDKTVQALKLILDELDRLGVAQAQFLLDQPMSNSGRLKTLIGTMAAGRACAVDVQLHPDVDRQLYGREQVISSDGIILDHCASWYNLNERIISRAIPQAWLCHM
jgi:hypothetical protein